MLNSYVLGKQTFKHWVGDCEMPKVFGGQADILVSGWELNWLHVNSVHTEVWFTSAAMDKTTVLIYEEVAVDQEVKW